VKVFIDLGAYNGDTLEVAINLFTDFDKFYAFEPFEPSFKELQRKFGGDERVILIPKAASYKDDKEFLFIKVHGDEGHSTCSAKNNVSSKCIEVSSLDFSRFISSNFKKTDDIVLKVNIEGAEYDMFDKMLRDNSIKYLNKIFCEWHFFKIPRMKARHDSIVMALQNAGFNLTGDNRQDAFVEYVKNRGEQNVKRR